jgi:cobalt/nickel transport system permease protein
VVAGRGLAALAVLPLAVALGVAAFSYAPSNWDSMTYHLSRVAHWLQHGSVEAYETGIYRQVLYAPGAEYLVLLLQALFFGAGGFTVLGVNALALGLLGPGAAWLTWRALRRLSDRAAAFAGAWVGTQVSTLAVALVLGLQHELSPAYMPVPLAVTAVAMLVPSVAVLGLVEGLYTVATLGLLRRSRVLDAR